MNKLIIRFALIAALAFAFITPALGQQAPAAEKKDAKAKVDRPRDEKGRFISKKKAAEMKKDGEEKKDAVAEKKDAKAKVDRPRDEKGRFIAKDRPAEKGKSAEKKELAAPKAQGAAK